MAPVQVLTIAGSDSGAGAGIQADLKAVHACGGYALTAITAVTAQNTRAVTASFPLPPQLVRAQIDAVIADFEVAAVKTGMLAEAAVIEAVAAALAEHRPPILVVDPVMIAKSGYPLVAPAAVAVLKERLLPLADVVTPNRHEAERLADMAVTDGAAMEAAGRRLLALGPRAVVVKGGHLPAAPGTDVLVTPAGTETFPGPYVETRSTHGTGCTFAAALATFLARGRPLAAAVAAAKEYVTGALRHGLPLGGGHGPLDHFWHWREKGG